MIIPNDSVSACGLSIGICAMIYIAAICPPLAAAFIAAFGGAG